MALRGTLGFSGSLGHLASTASSATASLRLQPQLQLQLQLHRPIPFSALSVFSLCRASYSSSSANIGRPRPQHQPRYQARYQPQYQPRSQYRWQHSYADPQFQDPAAYPAPRPKRSLPVRLILGVLKYGIGGAFFLLLGMVVAQNTMPAELRTVVVALTDPPPSDEETLRLFEAPDAATAAIDSRIVDSALAKTLRADAGLVESRPHLRVNPALRATNLTAGTLARPGGLAVPPLLFNSRDGSRLVGIFYLGENLCGHPGLVHGGMLATVLDEGLAWCCFPALPNKVAVTANLRIDYRKPVPAGAFYVLRAETYSVDGRKAHVRGWIEPLDESSDSNAPSHDRAADVPPLSPSSATAPAACAPGGAVAAAASAAAPPAAKKRDHGKKLVEADALYIEPRQAKYLARLYKHAG